MSLISHSYFLYCRPQPVTTLAVFSLPGSFGSSIDTMSAPAEARAVVIAVPRPPVPPVTIAVLPASEKSWETSTVGATAMISNQEGTVKVGDG